MHNLCDTTSGRIFTTFESLLFNKQWFFFCVNKKCSWKKENQWDNNMKLNCCWPKNTDKPWTTARWQEPQQTWPEGQISPIPGFPVISASTLENSGDCDEWPQGREALKASQGGGLRWSWEGGGGSIYPFYLLGRAEKVIVSTSTHH